MGTVGRMAPDASPDRSKRERVALATESTERLMRPQLVPVNVYETTDALVVVAPVPAVQPQDVTVDLTPGRLRLTARLRSAAPKDYLVHEWEYGGYERQLELPAGFGGGVEASLRNGQLAVRVLRGDCIQPLTLIPS